MDGALYPLLSASGGPLPEALLRERFLIVVSGLPRSGTSMMMGALGAGGMALVTDGSRPPDRHNPSGYFEHSAVKNLGEQADWLFHQRGKAVKILFHLLEFVPPELEMKVIFMERDLAEVVASQNRMLEHPGETRNWVDLYRREVLRVREFLKLRPGTELLPVNHRELIVGPRESLRVVAQYLGHPLDIEAMAATIRPEFYRARFDRKGPLS